MASRAGVNKSTVFRCCHAYEGIATMTKRAATDHPVHELIAERWSPYAFADRPVSKQDLLSLFEAARWAPSSYNEQPWTYLVAVKDDAEGFARMLSCLVEGNQVWAKAAPVLALGCTSLSFTHHNKPNAAAVHDLGLAAGNLVLEATARGLVVHQMIGILPDRARELYQVPEGVQPLTGLAIGYPGDPAALPEKLRSRDTAPRSRKPLSAFVFAGKWGSAAPVVS
jgi:nitroreductase